MVLTDYFVLSPVIGLFCHRRLARVLRDLNASVEASGPYDFAVRINARSSKASHASTASRPASVTIASRPLWWDETAMDVELFLSNRETENFCGWGWTGNAVMAPICPSRQISERNGSFPRLSFKAAAPASEQRERLCSRGDEASQRVRRLKQDCWVLS